MRVFSILSIILSFVIMSCNMQEEPKIEPIKYPVTKKVDTVDEYFGTKVPDPYRWLEDDLSAETAEWVKAQNEVTSSFLEKIPYRGKIRERLEKLINYERIYAPVKHGDYYYFYKNSGLQNQNVLYRKKISGGEEEVFMDPNGFSDDGTTSLGGTSFTKDGSLMAYSISEKGSDWRKVIVINAETKEQVGDTIFDVKFSGLAWKGNEGFYYSSYDKPKEGSALSGKNQYHKLYWHKLGTPQSEDKLVFGGAKQPRRYIGGGVTEDERYLVISTAHSTSGNDLFIKDLFDPNSKIVPIVEDFEKSHNIIDNEGSRLLIYTNLNAPNYRLVEVDAANPGPENWKDVIPETENVLSVSTGGGKIFVEYMVDVVTKVYQHDMTGKLEHEIELPGLGSAGGFSCKREETELYYTFTSFTYPSVIYKYDIASGKSDIYQMPKIDFKPDEYETKQVFYKSKDGTKVPMFIVYKKGIKLDGTNPTYLYGYGGFNASMTPGFSALRIAWLENGGVYAQANIRGGGEYGEKWHIAGTKMDKQNVFDDFIAAAEHLISEKYTSSERLAIAGGSNGGLLVGAVMTQRPELAKVALPAVGVMDMLRYHKFTAGAGWAYDYGTSDDSEEMFKYLYKYSPIHALKAGTSYPATMITTADHDDRVVPAHSFKFAATLQEHHKGNNPVLIRIETNAGHGAGTPISKTIEQYADIYSFTWYNMGFTPKM